jgi:hypothetical protein
LAKVADYFNLNHYGCVGFAPHQIRPRKMEDHQCEYQLRDLLKGLVKGQIKELIKTHG